ncbi:MAG: hypothetical protein KKF56_04720 [Nanoarchaeota archaeon]|nr:hypothetical protein [Nanoarchaeota archaeon]
MVKNRPQKKSYVLVYIILILAVILILNLLLAVVPEGDVFVDDETERDTSSFELLDEKIVVQMSLPAVDEEGNGVSTVLTVEAMPGTGRTLTDIDNLLFWADTQHSIRIAKNVAGDFTNVDLDKVDLIYSIEANASVIGGPSAGAALAIATISAVDKRELKKDVMITGSINHDGTIGPVNGILEKAKASHEAGANTLLVPLLHSRDVVYEDREHCEEFGMTEVCSTETYPRKVDVSEEAGVEIVEVGSVEEAMGYFF